MSTLLELITAHEQDIVNRWCREVRRLPDSIYSSVSDQVLMAAIRRSHQALLNVMRTGETAPMAESLRAGARQRAAQGVRYEDAVVGWLLYRQVLLEVLADALDTPDRWDEFVDRVDGLLQWVMRVLRETYAEGSDDES